VASLDEGRGDATELLSTGRQSPEIVTDAHARTISLYWYDPGDPEAPLTQFARFGAVTEELVEQIELDLAKLEFATANENDVPLIAQTQLGALLEYVQHHGIRGQVPGWQDLPAHDPWSHRMAPAHIPLPHPPERRGSAIGSALSLGDDFASLYERLGGGMGVGNVVETFYRTVMADPTLAPYFDGIDVHRVKAHQYSFISTAAGGPDQYGGRPLARAHGGLGIADEHFDRMIDHLRASLVGLDIEEEAIDALLSEVVGYRSEVVEVEEDPDPR
jgi:hemoglobin